MAKQSVQKGVLDSFLLTPAQRAEYYRLLQLGFPEVQARTMAQALKKSAQLKGPVVGDMPQPQWQGDEWMLGAMTPLSAPVRDELPAEDDWQRLAKSGYHARFVAEAKKSLHGFAYQQIHDKARRSAGGTASGVSRRAAKSPEGQEQVQWLNFLRSELKEAERAVGKSAPTMSEVHVDRPLTDKPPKMAIRVPRVARGAKKVSETPEPPKGGDTKEVKKFSQENVKQLTSSGGPQDTLPQGPDSPKMNALRLISGMDYHMGNGTEDANEARALASRMLARDLGSFDNLYQRNSAVRNVPGLDVDVGSGTNRQPGYLGLDLFPYDYGTAIFDITQLPFPFEDGEIRSLRMVNVPLQGVDVTAFLKEVQRTLNYGGQFTCVSDADLSLAADMSEVPGLRFEGVEDSNLASDNVGAFEQVFTRVRARLPWVYGADTQWLHQEEDSLMDIMVNAAMGVPTHTFANQAMANLLTKSNSFDVEAKVVKSQQMQKIVTSVVYAPDELDTDEEWMSAEDIENAAHNFLISGGYIGSEHGGKPIGADVVESYIAPCDLTFDGIYGKQQVPKGAWIMSVKVYSDTEWQKILSGDYTGFSVGGYAMRSA